MPILGLGTWQSLQGTARDAVKFAIDVGSRHLDCAYPYQNEIRDVLREKIEVRVARREGLFTVSKALCYPHDLWSTFHERSPVKEACQRTLAALQLDCLDLYLMHGPTGFEGGEELFLADGNGRITPSNTDFLDTWKAMEELVDAGMVKAIGVSNFNRKQIDRLLSKPDLRHKPANNRVKAPPRLPQEELIKFCQSKGISVTAYCALGAPNKSKHEDISLFDDPQIKEIALKYNKTPAHVLIYLQIQRNASVIPKSVSPHHIKENFKVFDFELAKEEMETFLAFKKRYRICALSECKNHKDYPFFGRLTGIIFRFSRDQDHISLFQAICNTSRVLNHNTRSLAKTIY
ncbi:PREDICTED: aldose reductase-like [Fulmarus glacialis]|uniref:aldose reductase-like n=1 Tax=Fulmarus glacialis TaxID=30455 RepID=UPI00051AF189|nr:PREDICTED: aldose reductase-like [Fulmarus glacialis]